MLRIAALFAIVGLAFGASVSNNVTCTWFDCDAACGGGNRVCERSNGKTWNIDCHVQDCTPNDQCGNADVVFVLDSSASLGEKNWWKTKQFVIDVSKGLKVGPQDSRIAVVIYSNKGYKMWDLTEFNDIDALEAAAWDIEFLAGNTNTYEGMLYAQEILDDTGREDMKHIVIVITDGKSNNKADMVQPQAEEMHLKGTEVFCVGISSDVDTVEIETIASEPKTLHAHYVNDYDALVAITNTVISDTCEAANRVECDAWSAWSKCIVIDQTKQCGPGISSRARVCKFYTSATDTDPETRIHTEHRPCDDACDQCASCDWDVHGKGYLPHDNCHRFIQCQYADGKFIEHEMNCGALYWRPSIMSCDSIHDAGYTCKDEPVVEDDKPTTPGFVCDKDAHATNPVWFIWHTPYHGDITMPCAPGTVFDINSCGCVAGGGNIPQCTSEALLEFPFNTNVDDICNRASGTPYGNVTLDDGAAYFDGQSRVEVGFLKNWFAENPVTELTVSLWFKYTGNDDDLRGIFTNGDCVDDASVLVALANGIAQGQLRTDDHTAVFDDTAATRGISKDQWVFVTMVYTGWDVKYYVNAGSQPSVVYSVSGNVANTQCPANIGFSDSHFFQGYIDDVRIYTKVLYDSEISNLYTAGRQ